MPIIAYKTMTLNVLYSRGFRVNCDVCKQPFSYLHAAVHSQQVTGVPLLSSDDGMRKSVGRAAGVALKRIARKNKEGKAVCPHCHRYQSWMVSQSRRKNVTGGVIIGALLGIIGGVVLNLGLNVKSESTPLVLTGTVLLGAAVAGAIGWWISLNSNPQPNKQKLTSMNDEDMLQFLAACNEKEADPALAWCLVSGREPVGKQAFITLGLRDLTGDKDFFPHEATTDYVVAQMD